MRNSLEQRELASADFVAAAIRRGGAIAEKQINRVDRAPLRVCPSLCLPLTAMTPRHSPSDVRDLSSLVDSVEVSVEMG